MSDAQAVLDVAGLGVAPLRFSGVRNLFARRTARRAVPRTTGELEPALAAVLHRLTTDRTLTLHVATISGDEADTAWRVAGAIVAGAAAVAPNALVMRATDGRIDAPRSLAGTTADGARCDAADGSPDGWRAILTSVRAERRLVLLAGGAVVAALDAARAAAADGVLLVVRAGVDRHVAIARASRLLAEAGAPLFGAVLLGTEKLPFGLDRLLERAPAVPRP